jgi:hypothetical protein
MLADEGMRPARLPPRLRRFFWRVLRGDEKRVLWAIGTDPWLPDGEAIFDRWCWSLTLLWEPRDVWIGVYVNGRPPDKLRDGVIDVYLALIPTIVLRLRGGRMELPF